MVYFPDSRHASNLTPKDSLANFCYDAIFLFLQLLLQREFVLRQSLIFNMLHYSDNSEKHNSDEDIVIMLVMVMMSLMTSAS